MAGIKNEHGIFNAKKGMYNGKEYTFTHRNPANGQLWADDYKYISNGNTCYGVWLPADQVTFK